jgi:hypothetical protein
MNGTAWVVFLHVRSPVCVRSVDLRWWALRLDDIQLTISDLQLLAKNIFSTISLDVLV